MNMKTRTNITNYLARVAMTLLLATITFTGAWARQFITNVMLIGGTKSEVNSLKTTYQNEGWTVIDKDLNDGCGTGSDYIYLLYKTADNFENSPNLTFITGFYLTNESGQLSEHRRFNGLPYHLVPYDGGSHFKSVQGNLNSNCSPTVPTSISTTPPPVSKTGKPFAIFTSIPIKVAAMLLARTVTTRWATTSTPAAGNFPTTSTCTALLPGRITGIS